MQFAVSTILFFAGAGVALAVILVQLVLIWKEKRKLSSLLTIAVAGVTCGAMIVALVQQNSGTACAMLSVRTLVVCGVLLLLHISILWDSMRQIKKLDQEGERE